MMNALMLDIIEIRRKLHRQPELSGSEVSTARIVRELLLRFEPDAIIENLGGNGIAAVFDMDKPGPTVMFRAELDALPIAENSNLEYRSETHGVSHACGHDGHITILLGLAERIRQENDNLCGRVLLLFQPAEETAQGAFAVLNDPKFQELKPDYIFALHNLPGFDKGQVIIRDGVFASASKGLIIELDGETSHAGEPEKGNNPVHAMTAIIEGLIAIPQMFTSFKSAALITIIHAKLGGVAFGTSPGHAEIMATLRSHNDEELELLTQKSLAVVEGIAQTYGLSYKTRLVEYFPTIVNDSECVDIIESAANTLGMGVLYRQNPFAWTEDFSYFTQKIKGAFFGIGAGGNHPHLHSAVYDFPEEIIEDGINILYEIAKSVLRKDNSQ